MGGRNHCYFLGCKNDRVFQIKFPVSLSFMFFFEFELYLLSTGKIPGGEVHGLDRYVPPDRVGFLRVSILKIGYHFCPCWRAFCSWCDP